MLFSKELGLNIKERKMDIPDNLYYTNDHEWIKIDGEEATIGITEYAQGELGDIVFLELPDVGERVVLGKSFGTIEAVKAAADLFSPMSGEVIAVNGLLDQSPELINQSPYEDGWIIKVKMDNIETIDTLLKPDKYRTLIA